MFMIVLMLQKQVAFILFRKESIMVTSANKLSTHFLFEVDFEELSLLIHWNQK